MKIATSEGTRSIQTERERTEECVQVLTHEIEKARKEIKSLTAALEDLTVLLDLAKN